MAKEQLEPPLYRGKIKNIKEAYGNISSGEYISNYVEGYYFKYLGAHYIRTIASSPFAIEVKPETLSISFPDMLDSENNRIFASLSKSGKGGDLVELLEGSKETMLCLMFKGRASYKDNIGRTHWWQHYDKIKVIGVEE